MRLLIVGIIVVIPYGIQCERYHISVSVLIQQKHE